MYLSVSTTLEPATDLGFLLMKHPDRVHEVDLPFGRATVFFPQATALCCEATLVLDIDPVGLVRGKGSGDGVVDQYVNDRPYAASSFLSVALNRVYRSAMSGNSRERPQLAATAIPLQLEVMPLRGSEELISRLFKPLGWVVDMMPLSESGASRYARLRLTGVMRLADALSHLYVLLPVLDRDKHYWVGEDEVEKLLWRGGDWLPHHPERELIAARYLKNRRSLLRDALQRLAPDQDSVEQTAAAAEVEDRLERPLNLHDERLEAVTAVLVARGARSVADLGCGEGRLLARLLRGRHFSRIIGLDASHQAIERAARRLRLGRPEDPTAGRVTLLHGALTYRDQRWHGVDAAALVEVIEHLDPDRLAALCDVVFGTARPKTVVITTPNADYNVLLPNLAPGALRHPDHRFEWSRAEFRNFVDGLEEKYGYQATLSGIGAEHPQFGAVSQMAVMTQ
ncbi:MAG: 3' terminal RNA ribose 2'-O-methyltransferase Hen1 [Alphaproteobacteria bacterium]|nr:3' terminal RNA ribose 2'-O-methyltransferase Hen1 [Alphaproteobacteria bacterium]